MEKKIEKTTSLDEFKQRIFEEYPDARDRYAQRQEVKTFLNRVRRGLLSLREKKGLKQSDIAHILGVSQPAISQMEKKQGSDIGMETIYRYASACGSTPVLYFMPSASDRRSDDEAGLRVPAELEAGALESILESLGVNAVGAIAEVLSDQIRDALSVGQVHKGFERPIKDPKPVKVLEKKVKKAQAAG